MIPEVVGQDGSGGGLLFQVATALVALGFGVRWAITHWKQSGLEGQKVDAESNLIASLNDEVKRLGDQNDRLAERLNEMQLQSVLLREEIGELRLENGRLRREITDLHREIERLRTVNDSTRSGT